MIVELTIKNKVANMKKIPLVKAMRDVAMLDLKSAVNDADSLPDKPTTDSKKYWIKKIDSNKCNIENIIHLLDQSGVNYSITAGGKPLKKGVIKPDMGMVDLVDLVVGIPAKDKLEIAKKVKADKWFIDYLTQLDLLAKERRTR